jgi:hypothetical protein
VVEEDQPTFCWKPLNGATSYTVTVSDSDYSEIASEAGVTKTHWTIDRKLKRGNVYSWQVTALKNGEKTKAPSAPGILASFQVMSKANADKLAQARETHSNSHLVMGLLYARAGLRDVAEREFKALFSANPKSSIARRLLRNILKRH